MAKRKKKADPFVMLPYYVLQSEEYNDLSSSSRALLVEIIEQHNGSNNGNIYGSQAEIMAWCDFGSPKTAIRALDALVKCGLIVVTFPGAEHCSRRLALRWLPPGKALPQYVINKWEIWRPGMQFDVTHRPVTRRRSRGRPSHRGTH